MISRLDWEIGEIIKKLEAQGLTENTIIMFSSDNGPHQEGGRNPAYFKSSGPFRGIKRDLYEGGIRMPFIVKWPGVVAAGSTSDYVSAFWDILPTLTDIAGTDTPENLDGISLLPILKGETTPAHEYMYWEFRHREGIRALRKGDWKLLEFTNLKSKELRYELYNLKSDPAEANNIASNKKTLTEELKTLMKSAYTEPAHAKSKF